MARYVVPTDRVRQYRLGRERHGGLDERIDGVGGRLARNWTQLRRYCEFLSESNDVATSSLIDSVFLHMKSMIVKMDAR